MFKRFCVGFSILAFSSQAFAQASAWQPALRLQLHFGGSAGGQDFAAQFSLSQWQVSETSANGRPLAPSQPVGLFSLRSSASEGLALQVLGAPVAVWSRPAQDGFALRKNGQGAAPGSWFSRNWWLVGLGIVAVGAAAAAGGGGGSDGSEPNNGNRTNCGASGTVVGPGGVNTDPNCI